MGKCKHFFQKNGTFFKELQGEKALRTGNSTFFRFYVYQYDVRPDATDTPPGDHKVLPLAEKPEISAPSRHDDGLDVAVGYGHFHIGDKPQTATVTDTDHFLAEKLGKFTHHIITP